MGEMRDYCNPVYPKYFADPFVWRYENVWYAAGTGAPDAHSASHARQGAFELLRSNDLLT